MAEEFGMESGWIYGNYTFGVDSIDSILLSPFYQDGNPWYARLAAQVAWPVTLPIMALLDEVVRNRGYLYGFSNAEKISLLIESTAHRAQSGNQTGQVIP